ncbi:MAG TPA: glycosyltransferase family 87 protein [Ktedonobacterales bacterium]|nr:glycosyltransferase family 87 protein [Ktedonobacterales bacterium]
MSGAGGTAARRRRALHIVVAGLAVAAIVYWLVVAWVALHVNVARQTADFQIFYGAAAALRAHPAANIYDVRTVQASLIRDGTCAVWPNSAYDYPPLLALALQPLTRFHCDVAFHIWTAANSVLWVVITGLLIWWAGAAATSRPGGVSADSVPSPKRWLARLHAWWLGQPDPGVSLSLLVIVLSALSYPLLASLALGQTNFVILCGMLLTPMLARAGHQRMAGGVLAVIALLKVYPVLLIVYYAARGRWRIVIAAVVSGAALIGGMALALGVSGLWATRAALATGSDFARAATNESLGQLPTWIALLLGGHASLTTRLLGYALMGAIALVFVLVVFDVSGRQGRRRTVAASGALLSSPAAERETKQDPELLGYAWTVCTMPLISPLVWLHHLAWLLLPLLAALGAVVALPDRHAPTQRRWLAGIAAAYALTSLPLPFNHDFFGVYLSGPWVLGIPLDALAWLARPLGTLALWAMVGARFAGAARRAGEGDSSHIAEHAPRFIAHVTS